MNSQKAIFDYALSKEEDHQIIKYLRRGMIRAYPVLEVVTAHRELNQVLEREIQAKKTESSIRNKYLDEQWNDLKCQEEELRDSIIKFNKLVQENCNKYDRAEHRIQERQKCQEELNKEIDDLTERLARINCTREKVQTYVQSYKKYQAYLENVVSRSNKFQSINDIFNRYHTLVEAKIALSQHQDQILQALEEAGTEVYNMTEEKSQLLMQLNERLVRLQSKYEKVKAVAFKWENIVSRIKAAAAMKNMKIMQITACCWNLYQQICNRKNIPISLSHEDIKQQLTIIKTTILQFDSIIQSMEKYTAAGKGIYPV